ncbi:MAG: family 16 glycosylhydrolase [Lacunisphaera sp.]
MAKKVLFILLVCGLPGFLLDATAESKTLPAPLSRLAAGSWSDDFDRLEPTWLIQLYSFEACGCNFVPAMVAVKDSILSITVDKTTDRSRPKAYDAGDMGSTVFRTYGLYLVKMKPFGVRGGVSAFYLMNRWQPTDWEHKEIDIEFLGKDRGKVQLTTHDFQQGGTVWKNSAETVSLGFDATDDFHVYGILWTEKSVTWYVDGKLLRRTEDYVPRELLQIRMNAYVGDMKTPGVQAWLGPLHDEDLPAETRYDWVHYYPLSSLPAPYRDRKN